MAILLNDNDAMTMMQWNHKNQKSLWMYKQEAWRPNKSVA